MVRPVCVVPALASSNVPSVMTVTSKRSLCLGCVLFFSCHSEKGISSVVPMRTAATAMGSCSGGPSLMPNTSLLEVSFCLYVYWASLYKEGMKKKKHTHKSRQKSTTALRALSSV